MWLLDGLFQVSATRTAGFSILSFLKLHPAMQVSSLVMMYISVFPTAISIRRTNIYEEKSLGIYLDDSIFDSSNDEEFKGGSSSTTGTHVRQQLGSDIWYMFLGLFLIALIEGFRLRDGDDPFFSMFAVMFETVSAYGTVGLSLGYPGTYTSFSAQLKTPSKAVIIAMQIRGRHRGLPYNIDRAVLLPSDTLHRQDLEQENRAMLRRHRSSTLSRMSIDTRRQLANYFLRSESNLLRTATRD
jgi:Trk-type K+ transport system membrane component